MEILKELVFIVGASAIARSDIKNGIQQVKQMDKNKAIRTLDETISMAISLIKHGFPAETEEEYKDELLKSFFLLSQEHMAKIEEIHAHLSGNNSLIQKNQEIH